MTTITTRSGKGSPLTNNEVDANFTNLNDDKVEASGDSMTGNLSFGDNNKAIFGAGSDLQIYHDASNSYVRDAGTGNLIMGAGAGLFVKNAALNENLLTAYQNGAVTLYYDNAAKLATTSTGIDVTGTVVSNGFTLENNAEYLNVKNSSGSSTRAFGVNGANNLYIGGIDADIGPILFVDNGATLATLGPTGLDVTGTVTADGLTVDGTSDLNGTVTVGTTYTTDITGNNVDFKRDNGASYVRQRGGHPLVFQTFETTDRNRINIAANGDISFYEDTGTTAKLFWDASAESLELGSFGDTGRRATFHGSNILIDGAGASEIIIGDGNVAYMSLQTTDDATALKVRNYSGSSDLMTIERTSGNVGIGTSSPESGLHLFDGTNVNAPQNANRKATLTIEAGSEGSADIQMLNASYNHIFFGDAADANVGYFLYDHTSNSMQFATNAAERMRIDSSGNLIMTAGGTIRAGGVNDLILDAGESGTPDVYLQSGGSTKVKIEGSNGNVGIGESSPDAKLHITDATDGGSSSVTSAIQFSRRNGGSNDAAIKMQHDGSDGVSNLQFHFGTSEAMRIDSSGSLMVGTTSSRPAEFLHPDGFSVRGDVKGQIQNTVTNAQNAIFNRDGTDGDILLFRKDGTAVGSIGVNTGDKIYIGTGASGVGFSTLGLLPFNTSTNAFSNGSLDLGNGSFRWKDLYLSGGINLNTASTADTITMTRGTNGQNNMLKFVTGSTDDWIVGQRNDGTSDFRFYSYGTSSDAVSITRTGNLLVGTTDNNVYNDVTGTGTVIQSNGIMQLAASSGTPLYLNRQTSDGEIVSFRKSGTPVGSLGNFDANNMYIGSGDTGIAFQGTADRLLPIDASTGSVRNSAIDLGYSAGRFKDLYLSGDVIAPNIVASNGVFLGGTSNANKLDDYEEGTWTPVLTAVSGTKTWSYSGQRGTYTKVGNLVTIFFNIQLSSDGSGTDGNARITGLPFTMGTDNGLVAVYAFFWKQLIETGDVALMGQIPSAGNYINLLDGSSSYPDISHISTSVLLNDRRIRGTMQYRV